MSPVFRIKSKKIVIRINCNSCSYQEKTLNMRYCKNGYIHKKNWKKIENKYFIDHRNQWDEINWFPDWCPLEDD